MFFSVILIKGIIKYSTLHSIPCYNGRQTPFFSQMGGLNNNLKDIQGQRVMHPYLYDASVYINFIFILFFFWHKQIIMMNIINLGTELK